MGKSADFTDLQGKTDRYIINLGGLDALHKGVELDFVARPTKIGRAHV